MGKWLAALRRKCRIGTASALTELTEAPSVSSVSDDLDESGAEVAEAKIRRQLIEAQDWAVLSEACRMIDMAYARGEVDQTTAGDLARFAGERSRTVVETGVVITIYGDVADRCLLRVSIHSSSRAM